MFVNSQKLIPKVGKLTAADIIHANQEKMKKAAKLKRATATVSESGITLRAEAVRVETINDIRDAYLYALRDPQRTQASYNGLWYSLGLDVGWQEATWKMRQSMNQQVK